MLGDHWLIHLLISCMRGVLSDGGTVEKNNRSTKKNGSDENDEMYVNRTME